MFNQTNFLNNLNYENSILLSSRFITKINTINQYKKVSKLAIFFKNTVNLFKIILKIFSGFFLSSFSNNHILKKQYLNKDNLVISHFDNQTNADYIFGNLFNDKFKNDSHSIFITNLDTKYKKTKLSKHIFKINLFYQIKIILNLYSISLKVLIDKSFQTIFEDSHQFKYLSMSYLEYDTFCNLLIFEYLKKNIELHNFKNIITTFEGHPWEILIFLYSHKKKIKSHAYLHTFLKRHSPYFFFIIKIFSKYNLHCRKRNE